MEPEVKAFLIAIVQSLSMGLLWLMLNMTFGVYYNFAFFDEGFSIWNVLFYCFMIASLVFLVIYLKRKWKGFKEIGE